MNAAALPLRLIPFMGLLILLPFPGTVAGRLLLLFTSLAIAVAWQFRAHTRRSDFPPCRLPLLFWIAVCISSLAYSVDTAYTLGEIKNEVLYTMAAFFAFHVVSRERRQAQIILRGLALGTLILCLIALFNWLRHELVWQDNGLQGGVGSFSAYLVTAMPGLFWLSLEDDSIHGRRFARATVALALALAFITLQRAVWPALVAELLIALLLLRSGGRLPVGRRLLFVLGVAILAAGTLALVKSNQMRGIQSMASLVPSAQSFDTPIAEQKGTDGDSRIAYWPAVLKKIAEHPIAGTGFGIGLLKKAYPDLVPPNFTALWHAHNVVLNYAIQMGLPGAIAVLGLFIGFARYFRQSMRDNPAVATAAIAGLMLLAGVFLRNQTNDFFRRDLALLFWCLLGIFSAMVSKRPAAG